MCPESNRATGLLYKPKYRIRCVLCGELTRIVETSDYQHLVVARHWPHGEVVETMRLFRPS